jgi:hypothetical protein
VADAQADGYDAVIPFDEGQPRRKLRLVEVVTHGAE